MTETWTEMEKHFVKPDLKRIDLADVKPDELVILRWPADTETDGGIVLPDQAQEEQQCLGWVVYVGSKAREIMPFGIGDTVVFGEYSGVDFTKKIGKRLRHIMATDIILRYPAPKETDDGKAM